GDLAVGAGAEAVALALEIAPHALEVVELAVGDDPQALVLTGDRLVAGGQVDDAESGMAEPDPPIPGDPRAPALRPTVVGPVDRPLQCGRRDRPLRRVHRHDPTHTELSSPARASSSRSSRDLPDER